MYRYYGAPAMAPDDVLSNKIVCEVCKIRCSDIGTLRRHEAGKKHRMNLDLQAENCMMSNVDKNMPEVVQSDATLDCPRHHEVKNCTISNVDKNIPEVVQTVTCEVCQIQCGTTLDDLRRHETGRNHKRILWKLQQVVHCEVCWIQCGTTLDDLRRHETSAKHKRILWKLQAKNGPMSNLVKETPAQPAICEVCKIQCPLASLRVHETGKKHKENLKKLQNSIMPIQENPPNGAVGASTAPAAAAAVADGMIPAVQPKKNKSSAANPEDLEVKKVRVCEAGTAQGELQMRTMSNVVKKMPKVVQTCEVCKIMCYGLNGLSTHESGKKHKKNLEKLQDSITPKQEKPPNSAVGASTEPAAAVADGMMPAVHPEKNKSSAATPEDLEKKKRQALEAGAAQGDLKTTCEVCKRQCNNLSTLRDHERGKKHKKNLEKLQRSITPEPAKPSNDAVGASTEPAAAAVADGVMPAVQPKKNKRPAASLEDLEVKRRRVLEPGSAEGEVKNCTVSNVVKKIPEDVHPVTCELCKMQCLIGLRAHKKGKEHKKNLRNLKNLEKFQDSITPKQENPPNGAVGASTTPAAAADVADGVIPAVQPKKKKRCASTLEDLEVKRRRVTEHGSAEGEVDKANLHQQVQQLPIVA